MRKTKVETYLDKETLQRMDNLIKRKLFDSRAGFMRRAVVDKLAQLDNQILS